MKHYCLFLHPPPLPQLAHVSPQPVMVCVLRFFFVVSCFFPSLFSFLSLSLSPFSISPFVPCGQAVLLAGWMAAPLKSKHSTREASLSPSFLCVQQPLLPPFFSHTFLCLFTSFHFIVSIKANLRGKNDEGEGRLLLSAMLCVIRQCERGNILSSGFYLYWQSLCRKQNLLLLLLVPPPLLNAFRNKVRVLYLERIQEKFFKLLIPLF